MLLAELTFGQELLKAAVSALATATFVTTGGAIAVNSWSRRRDERRQRFEVRSSLLKESIAASQQLYTVCQHTRRQLRDADAGSRPEILPPLHAAYLTFAVTGPTIEYELGARFGFEERLAAGTDTTPALPWERFHQLRDLLAVYYFNLTEEFPGDVLKRNSKGTGGKYHSGLDLEALGGDLSAMRNAIRRSYDTALRDLTRGILTEALTTG